MSPLEPIPVDGPVVFFTGAGISVGAADVAAGGAVRDPIGPDTVIDRQTVPGSEAVHGAQRAV